MADYGVRLGLAGATCAAVGFALDLEHIGWAVIAALMVMRPDPDAQLLRSAGRAGSVTAGALAAVAVIEIGPPDEVLAVIAALALAGMAATVGSRWYIAPAFTTFLVFLLLLYGNQDQAPSRVAGTCPRDAVRDRGRLRVRHPRPARPPALAVVDPVEAPPRGRAWSRRTRASRRAAWFSVIATFV